MSHFVIPNHTVVGTNVLGEAAPLLKKMGNKAFIVTGRHVAVSDMMKQLTALLDENGIDCVIFDGITGEPTDTMIENGVEMLKSSGCDFIIGIGGGSPLDSAKAIAAMAVNEGSIADYNGKEITGEILPLAAIPTTAGTGSEATKFTVITDSEKGIKMLLKGDVLVPKLAIVDSSFTVGAPKSVTSATGLDALTHAVEAYTSRKAFSMTDTLAVSAVKRIMKYLPIAYREPDNSLAREQMSIAALEAGICINNSSVTIVHGMSRPIGALFHVPPGMSNAMLLQALPYRVHTKSLQTSAEKRVWQVILTATKQPRKSLLIHFKTFVMCAKFLLLNSTELTDMSITQKFQKWQPMRLQAEAPLTR